MSNYFNEKYYLKVTLTHLQKMGQLDPQGKPYTETSLLQAIQDAGLTLEQHYLNYGRQENLNPNPYFNEYEYLQAKLKLTQEKGELDPYGLPYTLESLKASIEASGLTPIEYYEVWGCRETTDTGHLVNPSNAFDVNAYVAARMVHLTSESNPNALEQALWQDKTVYELGKAMLMEASPVTHYQDIGYAESKVSKLPLVQTVPVPQRVPNDPSRVRTTGEVVPGNYNPPTAPLTKARANLVPKPADVGGLAPALVAPKPIPSFLPQLVPGDLGYIPPPEGIVDTNNNPIIAPTTKNTGTLTDAWVMVDLATGGGLAYDQNGSILGTLLPGTIDPGILASDIVISADTLWIPQTVPMLPEVPEPLATRSEPILALPDPILSSPETIPSTPDVITHILDVPNAHVAYTPGKFTLTGTGYDNLTLSAQGILASNGLAICTESFNQNDVIDASTLRSNTGTVTIDTSAYTLAHQVIGSTLSNNTVALGTNTTLYTGGIFADKVSANYVNDIVIKTGAGNDQINLARVKKAMINTGNGEDLVVIGEVESEETISVVGGDSHDTLKVTSQNSMVSKFNLQDVNTLDLTASGGQVVMLDSDSSGLKEVKFDNSSNDLLMLDSTQFSEISSIAGKGQIYLSDSPQSNELTILNNLSNVGIDFKLVNKFALNSRLNNTDLLNETILNSLLQSNGSGLTDGFKFTHSNQAEGILLKTIDSHSYIIVDANHDGQFTANDDLIIDALGIDLSFLVNQ